MRRPASRRSHIPHTPLPRGWRVARSIGVARSIALRTSLLLAVSVASASASACISFRGEEGWQTAPGSIEGDWRRIEMPDLMAYSDTWFVVDEKGRGTVRGFANGAADVAADGGHFELAVIFRQNTVPVQQTVRVYFDEWTSVYQGETSEGTVLEGLAGGRGYNVLRGGRVLEVPFHVNGGRLYAERVNVLEGRAPPRR